MGFTKSTDDLNMHQSLGDTPNIDNGLSAEDLKKKFDKPVNDLQESFNGLIDELENTASASILGANKLDANDNSPNNIQSKLLKLYQEIQNTTLGQIPDGSITKPKMNEEYAENIIEREEFEEEQTRVNNKIKDVSTIFIPEVEQIMSDEFIEKNIKSTSFFISTVNTEFQSESVVNEINISGIGLVDGLGTEQPTLKIKKVDGTNFIIHSDFVITASDSSAVNRQTPSFLKAVLERTGSSSQYQIDFTSDFYFIYDFKYVRDLTVTKYRSANFEYSYDGIVWSTGDATTKSDLSIRCRYIRVTYNASNDFRYMYFKNIYGRFPQYINKYTLETYEEVIEGQIINIRTPKFEETPVIESYINDKLLNTNLLPNKEYTVEVLENSYNVTNDIILDILTDEPITQLNLPGVFENNAIYQLTMYIPGSMANYLDINLYVDNSQSSVTLFDINGDILDRLIQCNLTFMDEGLITDSDTLTSKEATIDFDNIRIIFSGADELSVNTHIQIRRLS